MTDTKPVKPAIHERRKLMRWYLDGHGELTWKEINRLWDTGAQHPKWYLLGCLKLDGYKPKEGHEPSYREVQKLFINVRSCRAWRPLPPGAKGIIRLLEADYKKKKKGK